MRMPPHTALRALLLATLAVAATAGTARAQGQLGAVYVVTKPPGAAVYVNGDLKGISPCGVGRIGIGEVEVLARMQGYADGKRTVTIKGGKTANVNFVLTELENVGTVTVLVEPPGAQIHLDRVPAGTTPTVLLNVRAGTHKITVSAEGHRPQIYPATVTAGRDLKVAGTLVPLHAPVTLGPGPADLEKLGVLDEDRIPPVAELPEEAAFEPVKNLLARRDYDAALKGLDEMGAEPDTMPYALRIARERTYSARLKEVFAAAIAELKRSVGQEYVLRIGQGIGISGQITGVDATHVTVETRTGQRRFAFTSLSTEQVVRLAAVRMGRAQAANLISFALFYAAEGEFEDAYGELRAAAEKGHDITVARSHIDSAHLYAAAVRKEEDAARALAHSGDADDQVPQGPPVCLLIDTHHGLGLPALLRAELKDLNFRIVALDGPFGDEQAREPGVVLIRDPGPDVNVAAYTRREVQTIADFVWRGGGLIFVGAARPRAMDRPNEEFFGPPSPFDPLLAWCGMAPHRDRIWIPQRPQGYPPGFALAGPVIRHSLTRGVGRMAFPMRSPSLNVEKGASVIIRAGKEVVSTPAEQQGPALVAGRAMRQGRIVVMANLPVLRDSPWGVPVPETRSGRQLLKNLFAWVSHPARQSAAEEE